MVGRRALGWWCVLAAAGVAVGTVLSGQSVPAATQTNPSRGAAVVGDPAGAEVPVSLDIAIEQSWRDASGAPILGPPRQTVIHWALSDDSGHWMTTMLIATPKQRMTTPTGESVEFQDPYTPVRYEQDDDGSAPRLFNARGEELKVPTKWPVLPKAAAATPGIPDSVRWQVNPDTDSGPRPKMRGNAWVRSLIVRAADRGQRFEQLGRRFGPSKDYVRGLRRFVATSGPDVEETLVDESVQLPVEVNRVREGRLVYRMKHSYAPWGMQGDLIRTNVSTEERLESGNRTVVSLSFSNLHIGRGR